MLLSSSYQIYKRYKEEKQQTERPAELILEAVILRADIPAATISAMELQ